MKRILGFSVLCIVVLGSSHCFAQAEQTAPTETSKAEQSSQFDLAMKHYRQGHYSRAIEEFNQVAQAEPNNAAAYYFMGYAHYVLKHHHEAIENFSKAFQADPKFDPRPYIWLQ
jgi:Tfp pilus assembly protein PilF